MLRKLRGEKEENLVQAAMGGNAPALNELLTRYRDKALDYAHSLADNLAYADDLVQDAYIKVWQNIQTLNQSSSFWPWLRQVIRNSWLERARSATEGPLITCYRDPANCNRTVILSLDALLDAGWDVAADGDPLQTLIDVEELESNLSKLDELTRRERSCCEMILDGYTVYEISTALGVSQARVRDYISSARNKLAGL